MSWWNPKTWVKRAPRNSYDNDPIAEEEAIRLIAGGYGVPTNSGVVVNEITAMRVSAVYRCVSLIAGTIASLPCEVYRLKGEDRSEVAPDHPAFWLLHNEPNALMTAKVFWETFMWAALMRGNGYALIGRSALGAPTSISWVASNCVSPQLSQDKTRLQYVIRTASGETRRFDQDDVLHVPFIGWDGRQGRSPMECARESIGLATAGQEFNERFFSQGNAADYALTYPQNLSPEQAQRILDTWEKNRMGLAKMRLPIIVEGGGKAERMDYNAEDSQLLESRSFQVEDVCRFFGVPPHMVGHTEKTTSWGTGVEQQTLGFVQFTLRAILKGVEQEIDRKILRSGRFF
jgi:HK97 family phage portal protein